MGLGSTSAGAPPGIDPNSTSGRTSSIWNWFTTPSPPMPGEFAPTVDENLLAMQADPLAIQAPVTALALPASPTQAQLTDQQAQATALIAAGADPGVVATLVSLGATGPDLALAAKGQWGQVQSTPSQSANSLLDYLTGNLPVPGASILSAPTMPQVDMQEQGFGPLTPGGVADVVNAGNLFSPTTPSGGLNWLLIGGIVVGGVLAYEIFKRAA